MDNTLETTFPNVEIALRIYLSLMVTNCITHIPVAHGNKLHYAYTCRSW